MTIVAPGIAARPVESPTATTRQSLRYLFYRARPTWGLAPHAERAAARAETRAALEPFAERLPVLRAYSTLGTRGDLDFLLWMVSERLEDLQELQHLESGRAAVEALTAGIVNKLLHGPTVALRAAAARPGGLRRSQSRIVRVFRPDRARAA